MCFRKCYSAFSVVMTYVYFIKLHLIEFYIELMFTKINGIQNFICEAHLLV